MILMAWGVGMGASDAGAGAPVVVSTLPTMGVGR